MKSKILVLSLAFFSFFSLQAQVQVDATLNPINILVGAPNVGVDFSINNEVSVEGSVGFLSRKAPFDQNIKYTGIPVQTVGKYYFNPKHGNDRFYVSAFLRYVNRKATYDMQEVDETLYANFTQSRFGAGFGIGTKVVSDNNIVFDFGFQLGRVITESIKFETSGEPQALDFNDIIINLKIGVGYRFGA